MAEQGLQFIFGRAVTAANIQAYQLGYGTLQTPLTSCFVNGFGLTDDSNQDVTQLIVFNMKQATNFYTTAGFGRTSLYYNYENLFREILAAQYPSLNNFQLDIYALVANAMTFGYFFDTNVSLDTLSDYIGLVYAQINIQVTFVQPFASTQGDHPKLIHPFNKTTITSLLGSINYALIYRDIQSSTKSSELNIVNYNFYDTSGIFQNPDLQLMKDCENQYYYLSGNLIYNDIPTDLPDCESETYTINTLSGTKEIQRFKQLPCQDPSNYIGPPKGVKFYREFNDGPYSSGDFNDGVKSQFLAFDKEVLTGTDYQNNSVSLFSFTQDGNGGYVKLLDQPVFFDANGRIDFSEEYKHAPAAYSCSNVYGEMRIGDNRPRYEIIGCAEFNGLGECIVPVCGLVNATGFKYAPLTLDKKTWTPKLNYITTNIPTSLDSKLNRALNINSTSYIATDKDGMLGTFTKDFFGNETWYIGPPQLNGFNTLPYLAFYQDFDNKTLGKFANVVLFPALGTSSASTATGDTARSWEVSPLLVASGLDSHHANVNDPNDITKATFVSTISSVTGSQDDVRFKFFGMGNGLGGQYTIFSYDEENAGYEYTGYALSGNGNFFSTSQQLINQYADFILGARESKVMYISGYTGINKLTISQIFAQDASGNLYPYYYFDNRNNPVEIQQTGWNSFAPIPTGIDTSTGYGRVYSIQNNENNFPRFSKGPYASIDKKILYPNALSSRDVYPLKNGFPKRVRFKMKVREEAIKEIYSRYSITNGVVNTVPEYISVIRPYNFGHDLGQLVNMFGADNSILYDFKLWATDTYSFSDYSGLDLVDNLWSPQFESVQIGFDSIPSWPSGRNGINYNSNPTFTQGILLTGQGSYYIKQYTGTHGDYMAVQVKRPAGVGLYHCYSGRTITGDMLYVKPAFSLASGTILGDDIAAAIPLMDETPFNGGPKDATVTYMDGGMSTGNRAQEPIYLEYVGGRKGGPFAEQEGGYHSKGIIGDNWMFFQGDSYGVGTNFIIGCGYQLFRVPNADQGLFLINSNQNNTSISTRGLTYNPMAFDWPIAPLFISGDLIPSSQSIQTKYASGHLHFDLVNAFPMKARTGDGFYQPNDLVIGPFDRDTEVFTTRAITGYTTIFVNGVPSVDYFGCIGIGGCQGGTQLLGGEDTVIKILPSGKVLTFNIYSALACQDSGVIESQYPDFFNYIGVQSGSKIYFRPRTSFLESTEGPNDLSIWNPFSYDQNGMERTFNFSNSGGFESLGGHQEFVTFERSGILYPTPDTNDFQKYGKFDTSGNIHYPTVEDYWKKHSITGNKTVYASGWREGSRISFEFETVQVFYDDFPYEDHNIIVPSGTCTISGEMGYLGQADASIYSEGFTLVDHSPNQQLVTGLYGPSFVSAVINRIPNFNPPSGNFNQPVLEAPSIMIQRENILKIFKNQSYIKLKSDAPDNYNKTDWPAFSDLKILNPDETIEALPPDDGNTFLNAQIVISASQGQKLADGTVNPDGRKVYDVTQQYQTYDSVSTDAVLNPSFITNGRGKVSRLKQPESGYLVVEGTTINNIRMNLI